MSSITRKMDISQPIKSALPPGCVSKYQRSISLERLAMTDIELNLRPDLSGKDHKGYQVSKTPPKEKGLILAPASNRPRIDIHRWLNARHCVVMHTNLKVIKIFHNCTSEKLASLQAKTAIIYIDTQKDPSNRHQLRNLSTSFLFKYNVCKCALSKSINKGEDLPYEIGVEYD